MALRWRLFLWFAVGLGLVLPLGLALQYRLNEQAYRESLRRQSEFVAELLEEKVEEPILDIEESGEREGRAGSWSTARLDMTEDRALIWTASDGHQTFVKLSTLLKELEEVPLLDSGYAFLLDNEGTLIALLEDGRTQKVSVKEEVAYRAMHLKESNRAFLRVQDPIFHQPCDLVVLAIPRVQLAVGLVFPERDFQNRMEPLAHSAWQVAGLLLLSVCALCLVVSHRVTAPVASLTEAASRLAKGEWDVPLLPSDIRELEELRGAFLTMRDELLAYLDEMKKNEAEKARMQGELELARSIQGNADLSVNCGRWRASGKSEPAREVGGDFMDIFALDEGRLGLLVGDVSGKGIPAALHTLLGRSGLKLALKTTESPAEALRRANKLLALDNEDSIFVTALVAVLEVEQGKLTWARAGHPTPLLPSGPLKGPNGPPLGLLDEVNYQESTTLLEKDTVLLYTDGFPEAENEAGEFLGDLALQAALERSGGAVWEELRAFRGAAEPSDDATAIVLEYFSQEVSESA